MSGLVPGITKSQKFNYLLFWLENVWISLEKKKKKVGSGGAEIKENAETKMGLYKKPRQGMKSKCEAEGEKWQLRKRATLTDDWSDRSV